MQSNMMIMGIELRSIKMGNITNMIKMDTKCCTIRRREYIRDMIRRGIGLGKMVIGMMREDIGFRKWIMDKLSIMMRMGTK